jgi:hypothetical protein
MGKIMAAWDQEEASQMKLSPRKKRKNDLVLVALALAAGEPLSPVQLQKAVFLLQEKLPKKGLYSEKFPFEPDNYGPFCGEVYDFARDYSAEDLVKIEREIGKRHVHYSATEKGRARCEPILKQLDRKDFQFASKLIRWIRAQSFSSLVQAIYKEYPRFKVNSIFNG